MYLRCLLNVTACQHPLLRFTHSSPFPVMSKRCNKRACATENCHSQIATSIELSSFQLNFITHKFHFFLNFIVKIIPSSMSKFPYKNPRSTTFLPLIPCLGIPLPVSQARAVWWVPCPRYSLKPPSSSGVRS